jgi:hypothetical protein
MTTYIVIHPYLSYATLRSEGDEDKSVEIPAGTIGVWSDADNAYMFRFGSRAVPVYKWAIGWTDYFAKCEEVGT